MCPVLPLNPTFPLPALPNPLLLATPVYAMLSFLSQEPGAPEQDR
jgi:hypothetical protein